MPDTHVNDVNKGASGLDKFYTIPSVSQTCLATIGRMYEWASWDLVVEPSAGNGSFLLQIPTSKDKKIGLDISPDHADVVNKNFFEYAPPPDLGNILVVGNPPFGKASSLAVKFFNHSAQWSSVRAIAFIVPKTFRRISIHNRLNKRFHLIRDDEIPSAPCSFYPPMQVKCCFQIWERRDADNADRPLIMLSAEHVDWTFLSHGPVDAVTSQPTPPTGADFALLAYGGKCGTIVADAAAMGALHPKSWHWIKSNICATTLISRFGLLDYAVSKNTARQNSIGRKELVKLYSDLF